MPVRTTRFAVSDMDVSGEPSVNDPPWNYRIVPGPPRLFGLDENPGTPTQSDRAGTHLLRDTHHRHQRGEPGPHLLNRARTGRDRTPHHGVHPHALLFCSSTSPQPRQFWARGPREEWPGSLRRPLAVKKILGHAVHAKNDAPESPDERRYALA